MTNSANTRSARDVLADVLRAIEPYAADIVVIGGWVHFLYLVCARARGEPWGVAVLTSDIDLTIPHALNTEGRPQFVDLITAIGFERDPVSDIDDAPIMLRQIVGESIIDLDILTEAADPHARITIQGQLALHVSGYPGQRILLENTEWISVGIDVHPSLEPPAEIRVPTLPYMVEIIRHPTIGPAALEGLSAIAGRYPNHYAEWKQYLERVLDDRQLLRMVADQLLLAGQAVGAEGEIIASVTRRIRRALLEAAGGV